jgi:putative hydrolase of the HAD superfamily
MGLADEVKIVLFDLGDTLIYFSGDWDDVLIRSSKALWKSLGQFGIQVESDRFLSDFTQKMRHYYENRVETLVEYSTSKVLVDTLGRHGYYNISPAIIEVSLKHMYSISQEHWELEADAIETLQWLQGKGYRLGIISNASDSNDVNSLLQKHKLNPFFEQILISAEMGIRKPHPSIFKAALDHFSVSANQALMVGDTLSMDIQGAKNVGLYTAWISRRSDLKQRALKQVYTPSVEIQTLTELKSHLEPG